MVDAGAGTSEPVVLALPFDGLWRVENSPARRVPSHGTDLLGLRYAIDFVAVDARGRSRAVRDWRTLLATEPPERYLGFGAPILAPATGTVVAVHDAEPDHAGRRSQLALVPYALGQAGRLRQGPHAVAGNSVTIALPGERAFVAVCHLRLGSVAVRVGDAVAAGDAVGECGNSGNSTEPHVHLQVTDHPDPEQARGLPLAFRDFRDRRRPGDPGVVRAQGVPAERAMVERLPR